MENWFAFHTDSNRLCWHTRKYYYTAVMWIVRHCLKMLINGLVDVFPSSMWTRGGQCDGPPLWHCTMASITANLRLSVMVPYFAGTRVWRQTEQTDQAVQLVQKQSENSNSLLCVHQTTVTLHCIGNYSLTARLTAPYTRGPFINYVTLFSALFTPPSLPVTKCHTKLPPT